MGLRSLPRISICIKGAGEMASAVAWRLFMANMGNITMLELPFPLAVRRGVSFSETVYNGSKSIEGVKALRCDGLEAIRKAWSESAIAVAIDPERSLSGGLRPDVVVDAMLAKKNLDTSMEEAPLVIALGPGFCAGRDSHFVIETNRGHNLGRIIGQGYAQPDTGIPASVGGYAAERVLRAPAGGVFETRREIGDIVTRGELIGDVGGVAVKARIDGVLRGLLRPSTRVTTGLKIGDIDPRGDVALCHSISDKARAIAGSVLEAILRVHNCRLA